MWLLYNYSRVVSIQRNTVYILAEFDQQGFVNYVVRMILSRATRKVVPKVYKISAMCVSYEGNSMASYSVLQLVHGG